jgi:hypothetical protein
MKTFRSYFKEQEGLAALGQQDLSDDHEKPEDEQSPDTPPGGEDAYPSTEDELSIVRKCMRIALKAGDKYKKKIHEFLHRLARDIPELQNLVSQLKDDNDNDETDGMDGAAAGGGGDRKQMVSTPGADIPQDPESGQG